MIKLWGRANSFNVQKAMWALGEADAKFERIDLGGGFGGLREPAYLSKNPNGYIPTIEDDGFFLWESHSIVRYVAEKYAPGILYPEDIEGRALASQWMDWALCNLGQSFMELFWGSVRTPKEQQSPQRVERARERVMSHMSILDAQLEETPFLAGGEFSMADIPAGCVLYRFYEMPMERPVLPGVEAWYERLQQRPAFRESVMRPFDELYGRLTF